MKVNVEAMVGPWDLGYSLDKHTVSSRYIGDDDQGRAKFDTRRTEIGEALYQLKYKGDFNQINIISDQLQKNIGQYFQSAAFVVPMPASKYRKIQPIYELAQNFAHKLNVKYTDKWLLKKNVTDQIKNVTSKEEKSKLLKTAFYVNDFLNNGKYDVLVLWQISFSE